MLLALDTATDHVSVALHDGASVLAELSIDAHRRHAELLTPLIHEVLARADAQAADVTSVAVGVGPGAFTGLRVGLATAQTFAYALDVECVGVLTLDVLAQAAIDNGSTGAHERFGVAIDARRREVFAIVVENGRRSAGPFAVTPAEAANGELRGLTVVGDAVRTYPGAFAREIEATPSAATLARIVHATRAGSADAAAGFAVVAPTPVYVRRPDVTEPAARASVASSLPSAPERPSS